MGILSPGLTITRMIHLVQEENIKNSIDILKDKYRWRKTWVFKIFNTGTPYFIALYRCFLQIESNPFPSKITPCFTLILTLLQWSGTAISEGCLHMHWHGWPPWVHLQMDMCHLRTEIVLWEEREPHSANRLAGASGSHQLPSVDYSGLQLSVPWQGFSNYTIKLLQTDGPKSLLPRSWRWRLGLMIQAL